MGNVLEFIEKNWVWSPYGSLSSENRWGEKAWMALLTWDESGPSPCLRGSSSSFRLASRPLPWLMPSGTPPPAETPPPPKPGTLSDWAIPGWNIMIKSHVHKALGHFHLPWKHSRNSLMRNSFMRKKVCRILMFWGFSFFRLYTKKSVSVRSQAFFSPILRQQAQQIFRNLEFRK